MKPNFLFAALAASLIAASCDKSNEYPYPSKVETDNTVPDISFSRSDGVNLYVVGEGLTSLDVTFNTNVPVISDASDAVTGSGRNFNPKDNPDYCPCGYLETGTIGRNDYLFGHGGNTDYTQDLEFYLVQSVWNTTWYDYSPYGYIETPVTFRVRGTKGTAILPEDYETYRKQEEESSRSYYLSGKILSIRDTSTNDLPFATMKHFSNIFKEIKFTPSSTVIATEGIALTLDTGNGTYDITVITRKRDNEKIKLLSCIGIGDVVEIPAEISDVTTFKERGRHADIKAVTADKVLKL